MSCSRESTFLTATSMRAEAVAHGVAGTGALEAATVGEPAPGLVDLGDVGVVSPVTRIHQLQQPGAVGAGLGAEDARRRAPPGALTELGRQPLGIGARVRRHVVVVGRLVERGDLGHGVVEQHDEVREGIAEEARDAHRDVDARAPELGQRDHGEAGDASRLGVPGRPHAQQGEDLCHVVTLGAHRRRAPGDEPDHTRQLTRFAAEAIQQGIGEPAAHLPRELRGQRARIDGVEVAARREHVDAATCRAARGA